MRKIVNRKGKERASELRAIARAVDEAARGKAGDGRVVRVAAGKGGVIEWSGMRGGARP